MIQYIVEANQIDSTVRSALEEIFDEKEIVNIVHKRVMDNVWTVLEDDCDVYEDYETLKMKEGAREACSKCQEADCGWCPYREWRDDGL